MQDYKKGFLPYGLAAFLIGIVGGFSTVLGPAFVKDMDIGYENTTWTALSQAISTAAFAPILGKLADVLGQKATLLWGIGVFTLGNALSALADSLVFMMAARFIVGLGTAAMAPVILAYIVTHFPKDQVGKGFALYMLISSISVVFGPALGGIVLSRWGWRTMLWICTAICATVFFICLLTAQKSQAVKRQNAAFDLPGAILVFLFFSLVLCIPAFGQNFGWTSPAFLAIAAAAVFSLIVLVFIEKRTASPILSGTFIGRKEFVLSVLVLFLTQGLMQANMTNTIVFVNYTQPGNTLISGYAISVMYLGMSLGAALLGPLADRFEPKYVLMGSLALTGVGCGCLFLFSAATSAVLLIAALGILGLGLGANGTIFLKVVLAGVRPEDAGAGTGTYGLFRDLSAPFGVAVLVPFFANSITAFQAQGVSPALAAVESIHALAMVEVLSVAAGIAALFFLPKIRNKGESL